MEVKFENISIEFKNIDNEYTADIYRTKYYIHSDIRRLVPWFHFKFSSNHTDIFRNFSKAITKNSTQYTIIEEMLNESSDLKRQIKIESLFV